MTVSVKDVAVAAGVSLGTVSNVLNRPHLVSQSRRSRVEQAMRDLGFVRNESARSLRLGHTSTLAYVMLDVSNPFFTDVAEGIEDAAEAAGLTLFLCTSHQRAERERDYLTRLEQQRVQGVLITPVDTESPMLDELPARGTPVVIVDRNCGKETHCTVTVDDILGGRIATEHLLDLGHHTIAFVGGPERIGQVRDRRTGALKALRDAGRAEDDLVIVTTEALTAAEGRGAFQRLAGIPRSRRPTAVFCANDLLALGVLQGALSVGMGVPEDLAIVGYDDIDFAAAAAVPLTSVRQPRRDLGETAAKLLIDEVTNPDHRHEQVEFTPVLVARRSTVRLTGARR